MAGEQITNPWIYERNFETFRNCFHAIFTLKMGLV